MATKPARKRPPAKPKLAEYDAKRDFEATPEPKAKRGATTKKKRPQRAKNPRFVIQEHDATRLHWDLRFERDGVAPSWAVPNGIPDDPKDNRLAVQTEDHPLEYLDFEGVIPKGSYGAGTMKIWDRGTYECEKWRDDEVIVTFDGERVKGRYVLFHTRGKDWMIHRMDPPAHPERVPMPERLKPMLAKTGKLPSGDRWGFEIKWDGIRALVYSQPGTFRIESRNLRDLTAQYPELRRLGRALGSHEAILDGEIVALDEKGRPSFERLQQRMHLTSDAVIKRRAKDVPASLVVFDVLFLDGEVLLDLPLAERRERLESLGLEGASWRTPAIHHGDGAALLAATAEQGLEGLVAKRLDSPYEPGKRSSCWIKVKNFRRQELVVGGWGEGEGRRANGIGALLVGHYENDKFRYAGKVGTGFTEKTLRDLEKRLAPLERGTSPFQAGAKPPKGAHWVEPRLVVEIDFGEWTREGILRHPSYKGLRDDKDPRDVVREDTQSVADPPAAKAPPKKGTRARKPAKAAGFDPGDPIFESVSELPRGGREVVVDGRTLKLTNYDKVLFPQTGFTKGDLIEFYGRMAPVVLPHLADRPLTLKRYPNGVEGAFFYEKQCPQHRPDWIETAEVWSRHNKANINFCIVRDRATLVWLGNLADIELHTSLARATDVEQPTMLVFDLDPGAPADIVSCCEVGLVLRGLFDGIGLKSFAKTSGSKGLQVYVPLNSTTSYAQTKPFAKAIAELLEGQMPKLVVSRMAKNLRKGRVLVDWSQNDEHKTTVSVYSVRARERPTVSTPVAWEEVEAAHDAGDASLLVFDTEAVLERVARDGDLFAPVETLKQELPSL
jgi:bifunctional non-homologous end joining protein LigD